MSPSKKKKVRAYHRGNVREDLVLAAEQLLDKEMLEDIAVRRLALQVGVTPGNFYNHFANLNDLLAHLAAKKMRDMTAAQDVIRSRHRKPLLRIKATSRGFVHFAIDNPQAYRLMFGQLVPTMVQYPVFRDAAEDAFEKCVVDLYGEGVYDRNDLKGSHARCPHAYAFFALLNGLARDVIDGLVTLDTPAEIDRFTDTIVESLLLGRAYADLHAQLG